MKLKHLIILLAVLAGLFIWVLVSKQKDSDDLDADVGQKLFEGLKTEEVRQVVLNGGKEEVTLEIKDGRWTVKGRDGYPANFDNIHSLISKAGSLTVIDVKSPVPDKYLGKFKTMKPGTGGKDDETGVAVTFKKEDGSVMTAFTVGKNPPFNPGVNMTSGGQSQYVKLDSASEKVHVVKDGFDYTINNATNKDWLNKTDFFKPEKHKSVAVTTNKPEDNWKIFREKEGADAAELKLADVKPGEEFDTGKGSTIASAFGSPSFNDVAVEADKPKTGLDQPSRTAVIECFDGFTYTVKIGKQLEKKDADPSAGASEEFYASVDVVGSFPETAPEWKPTPEEEKKTEEEKKKLKEDHDKKFTEELTKKKERLNKEKTLSGKVFILAKSVIDPLLKNRGDFMKDKPAPTPPATTGTPAAPGTPAAAPATPATGATPTPPKREPITATTPPISVEIPPKKEDPKKPGDKKDEPKKDAPKPAESNPPSAKPAEPKPADAKPAEVKPTEVRPAGAPPPPSPPAKPDGEKKEDKK